MSDAIPQTDDERHATADAEIRGTAEIPRRNRIDLLSPAERAIFDAVQVVEGLPADVRLTDAVILLGQARDKVADFIDNYVADCGATTTGTVD